MRQAAENISVQDAERRIFVQVASQVALEPVETTGARLRALRDGGEITIHPTTYRLVLSEAST
jgi:hypothetical protein